MDAWVQAGTDLSDGTNLTRALAHQLSGEMDVHVSITVPPASVEDSPALPFPLLKSGVSLFAQRA